MTASVFDHVLVPTDGSQGSLLAGQLAIDLLRGGSGRLTLLYVVDRAVLNELRRFGERSEAEVESELREHGRRYLDLLQRQAADAAITVDAAEREGDPFEEIVALARELDVDLIVMGHVGQRGTRRVLLGSVTQRVLDFAHCPVLVVKHEPVDAPRGGRP
ncbi:MAG: universal stress protein [Deinococcales bacterium]|jgi:nucleotide-binding universal stress UspA family protein